MATVRICSQSIQPRDAIGNFCLDLSTLLQTHQYSVQLYAANYEPHSAQSIRDLPLVLIDIDPEDILFVVYSFYDPYLSEYARLPNKKICFFHNVTPSNFFAPWDPGTAEACGRAYAQLPELINFDRLFGHSFFTAETLSNRLPVRRAVSVAPPFFGNRYSQVAYNPNVLERDARSALFVGRVVPNKKFEDLLVLTSELRRLDPRWHLDIVGTRSHGAYTQSLEELAGTLGLNNGGLHWWGNISNDGLAAKYQHSGSFICMSEHEGFCIPIFEAMLHGLPVYAYAQPGVREVLDGTGTVFQLKDLPAIAVAIEASIHDTADRQTAAEKQHRRALDLLKGAHGESLLRAIKELTSE